MSKMMKSFQQVGGSASNSRNPRQNRTRSADMREQDRFMPIANVVRIMRKIIPAHAKISDDAKETILESVSEFISFVTSEANRWCHQDQRKTITAEDVLWGLNNLGFDNYIEPLTIYLERLREFENGGEHSGVANAQAKRSIEQPAMGFTNAFTPTFTPIVPGTMGISNTFTPIVPGAMGITNAFTTFTPVEQGAMGITSAFTTFTPTEQGAMCITSAFTPTFTPIEQGAMGITTAFTPAAFAPAFVPAYYVVPHSGLPAGVMTVEGFQRDDAQNGGSTSGSSAGVTRTFF